MQQCPICTRWSFDPVGIPNSDILIVSDYPDKDDYEKGGTFAGRVGGIMTAELMRVGIDTAGCRFTYLWRHAKPRKTTEESNRCFERFMSELLPEFENRHVLMGGKEMARLFFNIKAEDYYGIEAKSNRLTKNLRHVTISPSFASALGGTVGELRLAIEKFSERRKRYNEGN